MAGMESAESHLAAFNDRVKAEWGGSDTAAAWQRHFPTMHEQLAGITNALVVAADPKPGMSVLDLAAGTGDPSLSFAQAVSPGGTVMATDFNPDMLEALRHNAIAEGLTNITTQTCNAHDLPFPDATFDLVVSRFGVMFFGETDRALAEMRRVLRPGGRLALLVWGGPIPGSYFGTAVTPFMKRMAVKPDPDGPGPMRFAEPGKLARMVAAAGFVNVEEIVENLMAPYHGKPEQFLEEILDIAAPFRNAVASLSTKDRQEGEEEVLNGLRSLYSDGQVNVTAPVVIVSANR